jgi:ABC-type multidrug transport system fused ATPase/permease subunit
MPRRHATAVVLHGPSGCGKTSLAELLVRQRDPDEGAILLDGFNLRGYAQADVHRAVGLAGEDAFLLPASIRENLKTARPAATDAELAAALKLAGLTGGLDDFVGANSERVSGDQRQRIVLARALLAGLRLLIVDEPEAYLVDEAADALITDLIAAAHATRLGLLLITKRPIATDRIDRVIALRAGRICSNTYYDRAPPPSSGL